MNKHIFLFLVLLLSYNMMWGQSDTLSYESIISYYKSKTNMIEFYQLSGNTERMSKLSKERDNYIDSLGDNYGKWLFYIFLSNEYHNLGDYRNAIEKCQKAINIYKKVLGTEHLDYAASLSKLADYYYCIGNYSEAVQLEREAMEIRKTILGENHPD